jgi:hypothetical protein
MLHPKDDCAPISRCRTWNSAEITVAIVMFGMNLGTRTGRVTDRCVMLARNGSPLPYRRSSAAPDRKESPIDTLFPMQS